MDLVNVRRGTVRVTRLDGIVVRLPLVPEYECEPGLPSHDAIGVLAHSLAMIGESEADFDFDAVAEGLLLALTWHFARRDEMAEIGGGYEAGEAQIHVYASAPAGDWGWHVAAINESNTNTGTVTVTVDVFCAGQ